MALRFDECLDTGVIAAERRHHCAASCPVDWIVAHIASHTSMNDTGPEAIAPVVRTCAPLGRSVEKS